MLITIKKTGINGEGIGYLNKIPVFVKGALVDETVDIRIKEDNGKYKIGEIKRIVEKSPLRVKEVCPYCDKCGGCGLLNTTYENQLAIKKELVEEAFWKYSKTKVDVMVEPSPLTKNYRNSIKLPFYNNASKLTTGLYEENSNHFEQIDNCLNHEEVLEKTRVEFLEIANKYHLTIYNNKTKKGLRYLYLRHIDGKIQVCLITGNDYLAKEFVDEVSNIDKVESFYQSINTSKSSINIFGDKMIHLYGKKHLSFKINRVRSNLSIRSFFQLNTLQAKKLYNYVIDLMQEKGKLLVEGYCGIGTMSMLASKKYDQVVGIEIVKDAVVNATRMAKLNEIDNIQFIEGDSGTIIAQKFKNEEIDTLLVDPPRSGLDEKMMDCIKKGNINKIIYVSCNQATLAKNYAELSKKYKIESIKCFDLFPNTPHVETVVLLEKK